MLFNSRLIGILFCAVIAACWTHANAQSYTDFEGFTSGVSVDGQGGWRSTNASRDEEVVDLGGNKVWRVSNAFANGSFGDQPIAPGSDQYAGETGSVHDYDSAVANTDRFYAAFTFWSVTGATQPGLDITISPDDGSGRRQSFISIEDGGTGINVDFFDTQDNDPGVNPNGGFVQTYIASGANQLSYVDKHRIVFDITFVDGNDQVGPSFFGNDIVRIYIDGQLVHTGTTWESYWQTTTEGQTPPFIRAIDTLLFRVSTGAAGTLGNGYYFDNIYISNTPPPVLNATTGEVYPTIQAAVSDASAGDVIEVSAGTYMEDVTVNTQVTIVAVDGPDVTTVEGPIGGGFATFDINASGTILDGFTITRAGNDISTWNDALNSAGASLQGAGNIEVRNCVFTGNRSGIDINASSGNNIHNNKIDFNHTGMILRNGCPNNTIENNEITNNRSLGVVWLGPPFLPGDGTGCKFFNNNISGNWYAQIENRTVDGGIKDFSGNWFGTNSPTVSSVLAAEPPYSALIPVEYGGAATAPGGQPDIRDATALYDYTPWLDSATDNDGGAVGFDGDFTVLNVDDDSPQSGATGRIQEALELVSGSTINILPGTYVEVGQVVIDEDVTIVGDSVDRPVVTTDTNTTTSGDGRGMWLVLPGANLDLSNVIFDGSGLLIWQAIRHRGSGTIDNCTFQNIQFNASGPHYAGTGIAAFGDGPTNITNCDMQDIGRIGIQYFGPGVNGSMTDGYTYSGKGAGNFLDYGFDIGGGAQVSVTNVDISNCRGVAASDGSTSAGILVSTFFAPGTSATIENSFVNNNSTGVFVGFDNADTSTAVIRDNDLSLNDSSSVRNTGDTTTVDASGNWHGSNDATAVASSVGGTVDYTPWLDSGTDTDLGTDGFQGDFSVLNVDDDSPQSGASNRIQEGIDLAVGSTVNVLPGSYPGNISVTDDIQLLSTGGAAATTITGAGGCAVTVIGDNVTIDGFTVSNPTGTNAICSNNNNMLAIRNNIVTDVGGPAVGGNHHAILVEASAQAIDGVTIEDNDINNISGSEVLPRGSVSAIVVGFSTGDFDVTGLVLQNNNISAITAYTADFGDGGRGAYGILLNLGASASGDGQIVDAEVRNNTITNLEGLWAHGIGLEGDTPGAVVENNDVSFLTDHKTPSDAVGVMIEQNDSASSVEIHFNRFTNMPVGMLNVTPGTIVNAEYNYWGSNSGPLDESGHYAGPDGAEINEVDFLTCTGDPTTEINANGTGTAVIDDSSRTVDYCPWLLGDGSLTLEIASSCPDDADAMEAGYQISVELWMRDLLDPATGYQAFVTFDDNALSYRGDLSSYSGSPFPGHIDTIDMAESSPGLLMLNGFDVFNGTGTDADSLLATLVFDVTMAGECGTTSLGFDTSPSSELSFEGNPLITGNVGSPSVTLDDTAPMVTQGTIDPCYDSLALATAAAEAATSATDNCTLPMDLVPTVVETTGVCDVTITVRVTDDCGNSTDVQYMTRVDDQAPMVTTGTIDPCYDTVVDAENAAVAATSGTDNCTDPGDLTIQVVDTTGVCDVTITVRVTDECGKFTETQYMTRVDNEAPMLTAGSIAACYPTAMAAENAAIAATMATDNCTDLMDLDFAANTVGTCSATVTVTVTDSCGKSDFVEYMTRIDNTEPVVMANDVVAPSDAGTCGAVIDLLAETMGSASDDCDGAFAAADLLFTIDAGNDGFGVGIDDTVPGDMSSYFFGQGVTQVRLSAEDACGNVGTFDFTVTIDAINLVNVMVTLDAVDAGAGVMRNIRFTPKNGTTCATEICELITFTGMPATGMAQLAVDCGDWTEICAKDEQHTLFDTVTVSVNGTQYDADASHVLLSGDTDNDSDVDINDVTLFIAQFSDEITGVNACPYNGNRSADFSLNGFVLAEDFTILQANWLSFTTCNCVAPSIVGDPVRPWTPILPQGNTREAVRRRLLDSNFKTRLSINEVSFDVFDRADLDGDGEITYLDVERFEEQNGFSHKLSASIREVEIFREEAEMESESVEFERRPSSGVRR